MYGLIREALFRMDAEEAHELTTAHMERLQKIPLAMSVIAAVFRPPVTLARTVWGLRFDNPLGIAAGFDKNATMVPFLGALGFGFIEVGTVTLRPQRGNPRPRVFRYPSQSALINRLGFNSEGAEVVSRRLADLWNSVEQRGTSVEQPPLFVNIGINRETSAEQAPDAYADCYRLLAGWADAVVVNVSSPNTPGLRGLQRPEHLRRVLERLREVRESLSFVRSGAHPILVKIAPDLDRQQLEELAALAVELADGIVATNTTISRPAGLPEGESGGLSGRPLFAISTSVLQQVRALVGPDYPLIGVGGIMNAEDAAGKLASGATLVQAYTGFIYAGPGFASSIVEGLAGRGKL